MTNKQILKKAIMKAVGTLVDIDLDDILAFDHCCEPNYYALIFSHQFATRFWGEEEVCAYNGKTKKETYEEMKEGFISYEDFEMDWGCEIETVEAWEYHLKQMVVYTEPLAYIEGFLNRR